MKKLTKSEIKKIESLTVKILAAQSELYDLGIRLEETNRKSYAEKIDNAAFELDTAILILERYEDWF